MFKKVFVNVVRHGKKVLEGVLQKGESGAVKTIPRQPQQPSRCEAPIGKVAEAVSGRHTLLAGYLARTAKENLATELRRRFAGRMQCGSAPLMGSYRGLAHRLSLMAFVGIGVAKNKNIDWPEQGFNSVCDEIKDLFKQKEPSECVNPPCCHGDKLSDYQLGPMIAKGCNAAVYQARLQTDSEEDSEIEILDETPEVSVVDCEDTVSDRDSDVEMLSADEDESDVEVLEDAESSFEELHEDEGMLLSFNLNLLASEPHQVATTPEGVADDSYDLALKMMFNYDAESSAVAILREMKREMLPAQQLSADGRAGVWEIGHHPKKKTKMRLPPHPNIVTMWGGFVDDMPGLPEAPEEYPHALPPRLNPDGCGRNKTLFLVMKRYPQTLREYLSGGRPSLGDSIVLLTQLLEAVTHLSHHNVAHRDLKSDNILVDTSGDQCPHLVVSDFGCCMDGDRSPLGLRLPYVTDEISKGGNGSLMAPEVSCARPGARAVLDFTRSDLWAVGALAYEIFGVDNPFSASGHRLNSATYREEELPDLPDDVPEPMRKIVRSMLQRDPTKRPDPTDVATALDLLLWAPQGWMVALLEGTGPAPPTKVEIMRWLLQLSAEVIFERLAGRSRTVEHRLKRRFLSRVHLDSVMDGVRWIWSA